MLFLSRLAVVTMLSVGSLMAQTTTTGSVKSITYNSDGLAISFVLKKSPGTEEVTFTIDVPSEQMTQNLKDWKKDESKLKVTDQDSDQNIEAGDTITA